MDIVLDSNIIISDPWFQSQKMRVLFDFAEKSHSQVLLFEVVETEVKAHLKREVHEAIDGIQSAIRKAERLGIKSKIEFDSAEMLEQTIVRWELTLEKMIKQRKLYRIPINSSILSEAIRRAAERVPPCNESGKELRDTILWLSFIESCKIRQDRLDHVFISYNTKDFAASDKLSLRPELVKDSAEGGLSVLYYPSLESFNRAHAEKYEHITLQWLKERLDVEKVKEDVREQLISKASYFRTAESDYRKYFKPYLVHDITRLDLELTDPVYVWSTDEQGIEISVGIGIYVEAVIDCELIGDSAVAHYYDRFEDELGLDRTLDCCAEIGGSISVKAAGEFLQFINVEDIYHLWSDAH